MKAVIAAIPAHAWKAFRDGEVAETVHCMNKTKKAFRVIVMRRAQVETVRWRLFQTAARSSAMAGKCS